MCARFTIAISCSSQLIKAQVGSSLPPPFVHVQVLDNVMVTITSHNYLLIWAYALFLAHRHHLITVCRKCALSAPYMAALSHLQQLCIHYLAREY